MRVPRGIVVVIVSGLLVTSCATTGSKGKETEGSRAVKQADLLAAAGQLGEALPLYERALTDPGLNPVRKADALHAMALIRLSPDPALRDLAKARSLFTDLQASSPSHARRLDVQASLSLLDDISTGEARAKSALDFKQAELAEMTRMRDELQGQLAAAEKSAEAVRLQAGDQTRSARDEVEGLRRELAATRRELDTTRAELQKKDEALKRLAQRMVKPGGE